jgi:hypothetical protein
MKQDSKLLLVLVVFIAATMLACSKKPSYTCAAYQSVYFLDQKKAAKYFTTKKGPDSLPLDEEIKRKDQYLLAIYYSKAKKEKMLALVAQETQFNPMGLSDSLRTGLIVDSAAMLQENLRNMEMKDFLRKEQEEEQKLIDSDLSDTVVITNGNFSTPSKEDLKKSVAPENTNPEPVTPPVEVVQDFPVKNKPAIKQPKGKKKKK